MVDNKIGDKGIIPIVNRNREEIKELIKEQAKEGKGIGRKFDYLRGKKDIKLEDLYPPHDLRSKHKDVLTKLGDIITSRVAGLHHRINLRDTKYRADFDNYVSQAVDLIFEKVQQIKNETPPMTKELYQEISKIKKESRIPSNPRNFEELRILETFAKENQATPEFKKIASNWENTKKPTKVIKEEEPQEVYQSYSKPRSSRKKKGKVLARNTVENTSENLKKAKKEFLNTIFGERNKTRLQEIEVPDLIDEIKYLQPQKKEQIVAEVKQDIQKTKPSDPFLDKLTLDQKERCIKFANTEKKQELYRLLFMNNQDAGSIFFMRLLKEGEIEKIENKDGRNFTIHLKPIKIIAGAKKNIVVNVPSPLNLNINRNTGQVRIDGPNRIKIRHNGVDAVTLTQLNIDNNGLKINAEVGTRFSLTNPIKAAAVKAGTLVTFTSQDIIGF